MVNEWDNSEWERYVTAIGFNLQRAREAKGYSQEYVASAAGISVFTYRKLEHGNSNPGTPANPRLRTLAALSRVLDLPLASLLSHSEQK